MSTSDNARLEELLDWLAEAVAKRLPAGTAAPRGEPPAAAAPAASAPVPAAEPAEIPPGGADRWPRKAALSSTGGGPTLPKHEPCASGAAGPLKGSDMGTRAAASETSAGTPLAELPPTAAPPSHAARLMGRLAIGLLAMVVLINIPLGLQGTAIARMIPSSTALVIRDGLLVKEEGSSDVYVYGDGAFHWITDIDVFNRHFYRWQDVHEVEPGFLEDYELGRPVYLLAKCPTSPHIYRLQDGAKRWIVDIATFEAEGYEWADVQTMSCAELRAMPDGETIPPGHGPAPQP